MARVHRLKHIERLGAADLAQNDAIRTHAKRIAHKIALGNLTPPFQVWRPCFQLHHMPLLKLQFGRVLNGDDAFRRRDHPAHCIQKGGLAGTGAAAASGRCSCAGSARRRPKVVVWLI